MIFSGHLTSYTLARHAKNIQGAQRIQKREHPDLIAKSREQFKRTGKPFILENVVGAPLENPRLLCGAMFAGLSVYRHRLFETNFSWEAPAHPEHIAPLQKMGRQPRPGDFMHIVGNFTDAAAGRRAMGIDWMTRNELSEAIPPAYSEHIGKQLLRLL